MKKRSLLARLRSNGASYLLSALILLIAIPLYQARILNPGNYSGALAALAAGHPALYGAWIATHITAFLLYRILLIIPFALLLSLPFSLLRIIVAQELMRQVEEGTASEEQASEEDDALADGDNSNSTTNAAPPGEEGIPPYAWRGKGFAIVAAWSGMAGLVLYLLGAVAGTIYQVIVGITFNTSGSVPNMFPLLFSAFAILVNTAGIGLLGLATLFFGAMIARGGRDLWPGIWVAFGYTALATAALLCGSAVAVASAPLAAQATLTTPAILLFSLWVLWLAIMLLRLKPEMEPSQA